jgi:hypothetical protein
MRNYESDHSPKQSEWTKDSRVKSLPIGSPQNIHLAEKRALQRRKESSLRGDARGDRGVGRRGG